MPTNDIGPCECCGGTEDCPCSVCTRRWVYHAEILVYQWDVIDGCGGGDGSSEPCCGCPPPGAPGEYEGQEIELECTQGAGTNKCNCTHCFATWDAFTEEWVPGTCIAPNDAVAATCSCPVAQLGPGNEHGQMVYVLCGC